MCLQMLSASSMAAQILLFLSGWFCQTTKNKKKCGSKKYSYHPCYSFKRLLGTSRRWPATTSLLNFHNQNTISSPFFTSIAHCTEKRTKMYFNNPAIWIISPVKVADKVENRRIEEDCTTVSDFEFTVGPTNLFWTLSHGTCASQWTAAFNMLSLRSIIEVTEKLKQ